MRVLWIVDRFPPDRGGLAVAAARQAVALAPGLAGLDVLRLTADLPPGRTVADERDGVTTYRVGRARAADESLQLLAATAANLLARHRHALVHGIGALGAGQVAVWAARLAGRRAVVSVRGNDLERGMFHGGRLAALLWTLGRADRVLCVSRALATRVAALAGRVEGVTVVPNGVDAECFRPDAAPPALDGIEERPRPWLAFSGEARLKKGLPVLRELAERLAAAGSGTLFLLGGVRADERPEHEGWRRGAGPAAARMVEVAWSADPKRLAGLYAAMDLVVLPSLWDGMPNALLEAMAAARPVLASDAGGAAEVVEDERTGFLVPAHDLARFPARALEILARPAAARAAVGDAARETVRARFSVAAERDALLAAYAAP